MEEETNWWHVLQTLLALFGAFVIYDYVLPYFGFTLTEAILLVSFLLMTGVSIYLLS